MRLIITDAGLSFVTIVELSGKTRKQHVHARYGMRITYGMMRIGTSTKKKKRRRKKKILIQSSSITMILMYIFVI